MLPGGEVLSTYMLVPLPIYEECVFDLVLYLGTVSLEFVFHCLLLPVAIRWCDIRGCPFDYLICIVALHVVVHFPVVDLYFLMICEFPVET